MMGRGAAGRIPAKFMHRGLLTVVLVLLVLVGAGLAADDAAAATNKTGTVVINALNVRSGAGTLNEATGMVYMNEKVTILGSEKDYTGTVWYLISYKGGVGYVSSDYIAIDSNNEYVYDADFEKELTAQGFPESYKTYLRQLHADYPQWVFQAAHTGLDWTAAVDAESKPGVTLVTGTAASSWKSTDPGAYNADTGTYIQYDSGNWVTASRAIIEHYMDPRNFLSHGGIFQFLAHSYDSRTQNAEGLQGVLDGTFMSGAFPEASHDTYNEVLMEVGARTEVNPYVLASMILVEQGSSGIGKSISGTVAGYEGYYNHFNVGAYKAGGMDAVTRGLWFASQSGTYNRPWNSIYQSIYGGASFYSENYVKNNKYTLYFKKFNVLNGLENVGKGQYMTNVQGAESEATALRKGYLSVMDHSMTFIIPVYQNMPSSACLKPTSSANNDNYLASLTVNGYELVPKFDRAQTSYSMELPSSVKTVKIEATANSRDASVSGTGYITLATGKRNVDITVTAASGVQKVYTITITCVSEDPDGSIRAGVEATTLKLSSSLSVDNEISLNWTKSPGYKMDYYQVFRSTKKNSGFGTKAYYTTEDAAKTDFADSGDFEEGSTYYYKVRGVRLIDGEKVYSQWSTKAWRTIKELPQELETPDDDTPVSSIARGVMSTTVVVDSSLTSSGKIRLDWKKSPGYKVDYYEVYRSVDSDEQFGDVAYFSNKSGDTLYYINTKGLKDGHTYYYKVRGVREVDGQKVYTKWSNGTWQTIGQPATDNSDQLNGFDDPDQPGTPDTPGTAETPDTPDKLDVPSPEDPTESVRRGVEATTVEMSSSLTEKSKIRLDWSKSPGYKVDYYEVWRSTERYSGYGSQPYYTTKSGTKNHYVNTKELSSGKTYYYRVRGVREIDGEKVYTQWSNRSWRTVK